jgi:hypothetical protein
VCCAEGREETINCPLDCEYLKDAHRHAKEQKIDFASLPNHDIEITEEFLQRNEILLAFVAIAIYEGAVGAEGATDWDVRTALESLIAKYRALGGGAEAAQATDNQLAAAIAGKVESRIADMRERETAASGKTTIEDQALLGVLAFLQRLEYSHNNGRKRCRAFIDFLGEFYNPVDEAALAGDEEEIDEPESIDPESDDPMVMF